MATRTPTPAETKSPRLNSSQNGSRTMELTTLRARRHDRRRSTLEVLQEGGVFRPAGEAEEHVFEGVVAALGLRPELVQRAEGDDLAADHDADAVAQLLGDLQDVRAHEDRGAALGQALEDVLDQPRALGVEADHGLV